MSNHEFKISNLAKFTNLIGWGAVGYHSTMNGNGRSWDVEAAHIYTDEVPDIGHLVGAYIGMQAANILKSYGIGVHRTLFIDNFHPNAHTLDIAKYIGLIEEHGFKPDRIVMESDLEREALTRVIDPLKSANLSAMNKHGALVLPPPKRGREVVLVTSPEKGSKVSCAALDAALYLKKADGAHVCVTILDAKWKREQINTRRVLRNLGLLGVSIPQVIDIYHSIRPESGQIELQIDQE